MLHKRIVFWCATILWMILIFSFSSQNATSSAGLSRKITETVIKEAHGVEQMTESEYKSFVTDTHKTIRKTAHFFLYFVLGILVINLCLSYPMAKWCAFLISLCGTVIYAAGDELHQFFVPGRGFMVTDIVLDGISALLGICFAWLCGFLIKKIKKC